MRKAKTMMRMKIAKVRMNNQLRKVSLFKKRRSD
jgi:hypothetical protein